MMASKIRDSQFNFPGTGKRMISFPGEGPHSLGMKRLLKDLVKLEQNFSIKDRVRPGPLPRHLWHRPSYLPRQTRLYSFDPKNKGVMILELYGCKSDKPPKPKHPLLGRTNDDKYWSINTKLAHPEYDPKTKEVVYYIVGNHRWTIKTPFRFSHPDLKCEVEMMLPELMVRVGHHLLHNYLDEDSSGKMTDNTVCYSSGYLAMTCQIARRATILRFTYDLTTDPLEPQIETLFARSDEARLALHVKWEDDGGSSSEASSESGSGTGNVCCG